MSLETANNNQNNIKDTSLIAEEILGEDTHQEADEHEHTLFAETIFQVGDFPITNSLLTSWVAVFLIIVLAFVIRIKQSKVPSRFRVLSKP